MYNNKKLEMEQKEQKQSVYEKVISILRKPIFCTFANIFSHVGTHITILIVVAILTGYVWWLNNDNNIIVNNIEVCIGAPSYEKVAEIANQSKIDSMPDVSIIFRLNSDLAYKESFGKYSNAIITEFKGYSPVKNHHIVASEDSYTSYIDSTTLIKIATSKSNGWMCRVFEVYEKGLNKLVYPKDTIYGEDGSPIRTIIDGRNPNIDYHINFYSDDFGIDNIIPYYYYFISFPWAKFSKNLIVKFCTSDLDSLGNNQRNINLKYEQVYPEPDFINNGRIEYFTQEKKDAILRNKGITIQAVDIDRLNKQNRMAFMYSALVGIGLAAILEIFIQLIYKINRLHNKAEE